MKPPAACARVRVIDLETGGNGPDDVCEVGWQDVEVGADGIWRLSSEGGARFVDPGRPISVDTMAVHHIRDEQVAGAPFWREVAPTVLKSQTSSHWRPIARRSSNGSAGPA